MEECTVIHFASPVNQLNELNKMQNCCYIYDKYNVQS